MDKIYQGSIVKDHLWAVLIVGGLGAVLTIAPLIVFYFWLQDVTRAGTELGDIMLNAGFFVALFLLGSAACFYLLWRGLNELVRVDDGGVTYVSAFSLRKVSAMDIEKVVIFDREAPVVIYDVGSDKKRMRLPVWRSNYYIDNLVWDLKPMNPNIEVLDLRASAMERDPRLAAGAGKS